MAQNVKSAKAAFDLGNYPLALEEYNALLQNEPDNVEYNQAVGVCYLRTQIDPQQALDYLLTAEQKSKPGDDMPLMIAEAYMHHLQYDLALEYLKKYQAEGKNSKKNEGLINLMRSHCNAATELLKYPLDVTFKNAGSDVNSSGSDYLPFAKHDGNSFIFTTRRKLSPGAKPEEDGFFLSNIFLATNSNGKWVTTSAGDRINNGMDEHGIGLSAGGDTLFFSINDMDTAGDIFTAVKKGDGYGGIKSLELPGINSPFMENACAVSADGKTILFSSDRTGGFGAFDLWMIQKQTDGTWSEPKNLGAAINTPFSENYPTLSSDSQTLFFTSEGHPGMGGYDLYFSGWDAKSNSWSKPQNMGYPINTPGNDKNISFFNKESKALYTSLREDGLGDLDIYELGFRSMDSDAPSIFHITAIGAIGESVLASAPVKIKNEFDELIGEYYPNSITGRYVAALYPGKYFLDLDVPGYAPYNEFFIVGSYHGRHEQSVKIIKLNK